MPYLFVYGTLRPASPHPMARWLARVSAVTAAARVRGRLYRLGRYPGAVRGGPHEIAGELLRLRGVAVLRRLDRYEGGEYRRRRVPARADGRIRVAWIWLYRGPVSGRRRIRSGNWFNRESGSPAGSR